MVALMLGSMVKPRKSARLILLAFLLAGCQTVPKGSFCQISEPIRLSQSAIDALSDEEVKALLSHNRKGKAICGWSA